MIKLIKRLIAWSLLGLLLVVGILTYQLLSFQHGVVDLQEPRVFLIKSGSSIKGIAQDLTRQKIINDPWLFILLAKLKGVETSVRAGEYSLEAGHTPDDLLEIFTSGSSIQYSFTVIEGWSFRQMIAALAQDPIIEHTIAGKSNEEIMHLIGYPEQHPEGMFFPDTYRFPKGTSDVDFLRRAYQVMQQHLEREWGQRDSDLPLKSSYEALILASIIEKETGVGFERPLIGGVFIQRLKRNMRLQTDPTVIYGLGENFDGDIRFRDLKKDTPYNTYLHAGLTPTPIALPGLDAIRAALHPADTKALYFVSKGDGTHYFSETLEEHNEAVNRYQLQGRKKSN
ncbi:MAG: endolytic transglycosylase MltG [Gammaproteobacteria bacterium]|nr:MAG: endolytic transglycosylase MltG [Gammaproteobacteria bacterium]UCH41755.1 MAG: endolytic transglycosylase MltG [Gammaproteobacteria bacterium]